MSSEGGGNGCGYGSQQRGYRDSEPVTARRGTFLSANLHFRSGPSVASAAAGSAFPHRRRRDDDDGDYAYGDRGGEDDAVAPPQTPSRRPLSSRPPAVGSRSRPSQSLWNDGGADEQGDERSRPTRGAIDRNAPTTQGPVRSAFTYAAPPTLAQDPLRPNWPGDPPRAAVVPIGDRAPAVRTHAPWPELQHPQPHRYASVGSGAVGPAPTTVSVCDPSSSASFVPPLPPHMMQPPFPWLQQERLQPGHAPAALPQASQETAWPARPSWYGWPQPSSMQQQQQQQPSQPLPQEFQMQMQQQQQQQQQPPSPPRWSAPQPPTHSWTTTPGLMQPELAQQQQQQPPVSPQESTTSAGSLASLRTGEPTPQPVAATRSDRLEWKSVRIDGGSDDEADEDGTVAFRRRGPAGRVP